MHADSGKHISREGAKVAKNRKRHFHGEHGRHGESMKPIAAGAFCLLLVFLMTGGLGLLVPPIQNLHEGCPEYCSKSTLGIFAAALLAGATDLVWCAICGPVDAKDVDRAWTAARAALCLAFLFNLAVGQDPCCAALNWDARTTDWSTIWEFTPGAPYKGIANHEGYGWDPDLQMFTAGHGA